MNDGRNSLDGADRQSGIDCFVPISKIHKNILIVPATGLLCWSRIICTSRGAELLNTLSILFKNMVPIDISSIPGTSTLFLRIPIGTMIQYLFTIRLFHEFFT